MNYILKMPFGANWFLTVDKTGAHGSETIEMALREKNRQGQPGRRLAVNWHMPRGKLISLAFDLLDLADRMQPSTVYATSDCALSAKAEEKPSNQTFQNLLSAAKVDAEPGPEAIAARKNDVAKRFANLEKRMQTLQLTQRVLENCNEETHQTLHALLTMARDKKHLPLKAELVIDIPKDFMPSENVRVTKH